MLHAQQIAGVLANVKLPLARCFRRRFIGRAQQEPQGEGRGEHAGDAGDVTVEVMRGTANRVAMRLRESAFQPTVHNLCAPQDAANLRHGMSHTQSAKNCGDI